jgi:hypothetical protein
MDMYFILSNGKMNGRILLLVLVCVVKKIKGSNDISLSTATLRDVTSPKPSTVYRRINVELNFDGKTIPPLDLFRLKERDAKKSRRSK